MTTLSFATLRKANITRLPLFKNSRGEPAHSMPDGSDWSLNDWMTAILGELGEAANLVKKIRRGDMPLEAARDALGDEFADVVIYCDLTAFQLKNVISADDVFDFKDLNNLVKNASLIIENELSTLSDCMANAAAAMYEIGLEDRACRVIIHAIARASFLAGIDLGAKVREKFNIVSRRVGADVFINEDDCVVDHNGSAI